LPLLLCCFRIEKRGFEAVNINLIWWERRKIKEEGGTLVAELLR
jgi:hypothetical protein